MKNKILTLAMTGSMMLVLAHNAIARQSAQKSQSIVAKNDSVSDYQKFRQEAEMKIQKNEKNIAMLKKRIANDKKAIGKAYDKKVAVLEQKNNELRKEMERGKNTGNARWVSFRSDFNNSMNSLEKSIKDLMDNK